ncbi:MAG: DNA polymerase III subunit alpha [Myxococcota bacterium]
MSLAAVKPADPETYVELRAASAFSFLRGASHPEELVERAVELGYRRLAITDHDGLYGVVRAFRVAKPLGLHIITGAEIHLEGYARTESEAPRSLPGLPPSLVLLATDRAAYGRLSRLLSEGKLRMGKGGFQLSFADVARYAEGLFAIHVGTPDPLLLAQEKDAFGDRLSIAIERNLSPFDRARLEAAQKAAGRFGIALVVTGGVLMHDPSRKPLQDILSAARMGVKLEDAGRRLAPNAVAVLRSPAEMHQLFDGFPEALARTLEIADACTFRLDELKHEFATELIPGGETPLGYLRQLVEKGAKERWPAGVPRDVRQQIEHEMKLIAELDFAGYFLTVWDIVRFARSLGILCQGRGSAANSVVCYALGITSIDPVRMSLLFERFISAERGEPPDIDVDFEHERREEVIQYVFEKYGREHAAMVSTVISYRGRSAFREVGKVFGLADDQLERLSSMQSEFRMAEDDEEKAPSGQEDPRNRYWASTTPLTLDSLKAAGLDPHDPIVRQVIERAVELRGLPRHLGQHSGGIVISRKPVPEMFPVENATMPFRTVGSWDKDDLEALNIFKIDLLGLGMLSAVRRTFEYVKTYENIDYTLANIPAEDPKVYDMISDADTIGTFQVESRAQMQTLPKLKPRTFYDLVVSVAIIRPGPIQGDMVHPYLRRRAGEEAIEYPHPALEEILGRTCGVPLFQEQVMKIAVKVAGFTGGEADYLRRAIGWNSKTHIDALKEKLIQGMTSRGINLDYAERIFRMIQGFGGYGFPESHSASFALIAYASCYLKRYHPAAFLAAMLNSQPLGFYSPNTLIQDGQRHGVEVRPPSVIESDHLSTLEDPDPHKAQRWFEAADRPKCAIHTPWADHQRIGVSHGRKLQPAVRIGLHMVRKMSAAIAERIVKARQEKAPETIADLVARAAIPRDVARNLAAAGAFDGIAGSERRQAMWKVEALGEPSSMLAGSELMNEGQAPLPPMNEEEILAADYGITGVSTRRHPMAVLRPAMERQGILSYRQLEEAPDGKRIRVGGLVTTRQRPGTASGVVFITLEDEFGHMNLVVFTQVFERYRTLARDAAFLVVAGKVQREKGVTNVIVERFEPMYRDRPENELPKGRYDRFYW